MTVGQNRSELVRAEHGGQTVSITVDGVDETRREQKGKRTRFEDAIGNVDLVVETADDGFAVSAEIEGPSDAHKFRFRTSIPEGASLALNGTVDDDGTFVEDGSIDIIGEDGISIGTFAAPWATDASGAAVATSYRLKGDTIIQTVKRASDIVYPVVADPKFTWGWITGTVYFDKFETQAICALGIGAFNWLGLSGFWAGLLSLSAAGGSWFRPASRMSLIGASRSGVTLRYSFIPAVTVRRG